MTKRLLILFLLFPFILPLNAQDETAVMKTKNGELEGTLSLPQTKQTIPVVLIIAGSGPTDRNGNQDDLENNSLKYMAEELRKNDIAAFRFDKRGVGQSAGMGDGSDPQFETYVNDVRDWINFLAADKRFSRIIVAGHSEGSLLGILASQKNKKVNAFISIAGAGRPIDIILKEQLNNLPDNVKTIVFDMMERVKKGDTITNVPPIFYPLFGPTIQPYMHAWLQYDPAVEIKKLKMPVLIVQGTTDLQVSVKDAELLAGADPKNELKIITNMNHVLKNCEATDKDAQKPYYSNPDLPINTELVKSTVEFIRKSDATKKN
jgi:pimeloyl-ACP methyl ester carboxylesterase